MADLLWSHPEEEHRCPLFPFATPNLTPSTTLQILSFFEISAPCYLDFTFSLSSLKFLLLGSVSYPVTIVFQPLTVFLKELHIQAHLYIHLCSVKLSLPVNMWKISASLRFGNVMKMSLVTFLWPWPEVLLPVCCFQNIPRENIEQSCFFKPISPKYQEEIYNNIPLTDPEQ